MAFNVSQVRMYINYSRGSFQLKQVKAFSETDSSSTQVITTIGVQGGAGNQDTEGGGELSLEVFRTDSPEVDYYDLKARKEFFAFSVQDRFGERWQWQDCRVANIARSADNEGENTQTVQLTFCNRRRLPTVGA